MRKQIKSLMLGNGLAQALQFGSILILSRIYEPSDFGFLAQVQSIAMIGAIWVTLQLHLTIPLQKTIEEAKQAIKIIEKIAFSLLLITIIPALIIGEEFAYAVILSLFLGLANTYNSYLVYGGQFGKLSGFYVVRAILIITLQILLSILKIDNGLVVATLAGELFAAVYLRFKRVGSISNGVASWNQILNYIKNNKAFSIYGSIQETVSVVAFFTPLFMFSYKYGDDVGGQYAMANRLVWAPVVLLSSSFAQVYYHKIGRLDEIRRINIIGKEAKLLILVGLVVALSTFFMVDLFHKLLGSDWRAASELLPIQLLWGLFFLASTPFRVVGRAIQMQRQQIMLDSVFIAIIIGVVMTVDIKPQMLMFSVAAAALVQHSLICHFVYSKVNG